MSRAEWILGGILVVLLVVVAAAAFIFWFPTNSDNNPNNPDSNNPEVVVVNTTVPQAAPTSIFQGNTSFVAFSAARERAAEWQEDAILLDATATWPDGVTEADILDGTETWSFTFYSPSRGAAAYLNVLASQVIFVNETDFTPNTPILARSSTEWQIDSNAAIQTLLEKGGSTFLREQGISVLTMNLTTANPSGRIEWLISLFSTQTGNAFTLRLDATTGEQIDTTP